jgi:hypothetical protein
MPGGPVQHLNRASASMEIMWRLLLMIFEEQVAGKIKQNETEVRNGCDIGI